MGGLGGEGNKSCRFGTLYKPLFRRFRQRKNQRTFLLKKEEKAKTTAKLVDLKKIADLE